MTLAQKDSVKFQIELTQQYHEKVNKSHREALLREQMKAIQLELGINSTDKKGKKSYREKIEEAMMPEEVKETALEQLDKLMMGWSGDPASVLLEVLDPEQNNIFNKFCYFRWTGRGRFIIYKYQFQIVIL